MLRFCAVFLTLIGTSFAQYEAGHSPPIGASVSIDNPHSQGVSPLLPPSNTLYFPPPEIPHPDPRYIGYFL